MQRLRRSISVGQHRRRQSEDSILPFGDHFIEESNTRNSFDTFVIPGRTRYPSSTATEPQLLDLRVAAQLLKKRSKNSTSPDEEISHDGKRSIINHHDIEGMPSKTSQYFNDIFQGPFDSKPSSRVVSSATGSDWSSTSFHHSSLQSHVSQVRATDEYVENYNSLAAKNGLHNLSTVTDASEHMDIPKANEKTKSAPSRSLWARIVRSSSSSSMKRLKPHHLNHKSSIGSLLPFRQRPLLKCQSLEETYRLGGISIVQLPASYAATNLTVPTYLAATANYLALYGRDASGIFRIPGQSSTVNGIYDYYAVQIQSAERAAGLVHATIGSNELPPKIHCTIHDVASAFKRFLWDIPGGILGSVPLFSSLHEISLMQVVDNDSRCVRIQAKLIALALLCLKSERRIALISTVFGLLAFLCRETTVSIHPLDGCPCLPVENMNAKSLSVIFAPLLLGSLTESIAVETSKTSPTLQSAFETPRKGMFRHGKSPKSPGSIEQSPGLAIGVKRTSAAASVVEMLIRNWQVIVGHMRALQIDKAPQRRSNSSPSVKDRLLSQQRHTNNDDCSEIKITRRYMPRKDSVDESNNTNPRWQQKERELTSNLLESNVKHGNIDSPHLSAHYEPPILDTSLVTSEIQQQSNTPPAALGGTSGPGLQGNSSCESSVYQEVPKTPLGRVTALAWWEKKTHSSSSSRKDRSHAFALSNTGTQGFKSSIPSVVHSRIASTAVDSATSRGLTAIGVEDETLDICRTLDLPALKKQEGESEAQPPVDNSSATLNHRESEFQDTSCGLVPYFATMATLPYTELDVSLSKDDSNKDDLRPDKLQIQNVPANVVGPQSSQLREGLLSSSTKYNSTPTLAPKKQSPSMIPKPVRSSGHGRGAANSSTVDQIMIANHPASAPPKIAKQHLTSNSAQLSQVQSASEVLERRAVSIRDTSAYGQTDRYLRGGKEYAIGHPSQLISSPSNEPSIARRIAFRASHDNHCATSRMSSGDTHTDDISFWHPNATTGPPRENVGTLYKEIQKLKKELDSRYEENLQLRQQLDAMRRFRSSGTLSEQLQEKEREVSMWRRRAEWAETTLFRKRKDGDGVDSRIAANQRRG